MIDFGTKRLFSWKGRCINTVCMQAKKGEHFLRKILGLENLIGKITANHN
jgi:hypothetical protein